MIVKEYFDEAVLRYIYDNYYTLFPRESEIKEERVENIFKKSGETNKDFDWNTFQYNSIKKILDKSKNGVIEIKYIQKDGEGRRYPEGNIGLCALSRTIRHSITNMYSIDIDIKNSSPSILYNILVKENEKLDEKDKINFKNLQYYIKNREEVIKMISEGKGMDRTEVKKLIVAIINNKYIPKEELETYPIYFIEFYWEIFHIRKKLIDIFKDLYDKVVKEKDNGDDLSEKEEDVKIKKTKNYLGSFMTKLLFNYEDQIIMCCVKVFKDRKIDIHGLQFDGFPFDIKEYNLELLEVCKEEVKKKMDFDIEFDFKKLNEIIEIEEDKLESYRFDVSFKQYVGNDLKKMSLEETMTKIGNDVMIKDYEIILKSCYNILQDINGTFYFMKKFMKNSKHERPDEELNILINTYKDNQTIQDKKLGENSLLKILKEVEKENKKKEKDLEKKDKEKEKYQKKNDFLREKEEQKKKKIEKDLEKVKEKSYEDLKFEFEKNNMLIGAYIVYVDSKDELIYLTYSAALTKYKEMIYFEYDDEKNKIIEKLFLEKWIKDPLKKKYERTDFYPNIKDCPSYIYNLFKGFNAEKYNPRLKDNILFKDESINEDEYENEELSEDELFKNIEFIVNHINLITDGHKDFLLKWLSWIIQNPSKKTEHAPLLRDQGSAIDAGGGTGKNLLLEFYGKKILGSRYFLVIASNKELYNSFNSLLEGKLFVLVEEANCTDNHTNPDSLKSYITRTTLCVNRKGIPQYVVDDHINYIFCTNNNNPLPIRMGDRRHSVFDSNPIMRGDIDYFNKLKSLFDDDHVTWCFYQYLKRYKTYNIQSEFFTNTPNTIAYKEIKELNAPIYFKWILNMVKNRSLENKPVAQLYEEYIEWIKKNHKSNEDKPMSLTAFGLLLNNEKVTKKTEEDVCIEIIGEKKHTKKCIILNWCIPSIVQSLKKNYFLEPDFEY